MDNCNDINCCNKCMNQNCCICCKGDTGATGADGVTPIIGINGNWWINGVDTGMPSQGMPGQPGTQGVADTISVKETLTVDSTTPANVVDDYQSGTHNLSFYIPKGQDSPQNTLAVAQLNKTSTQTLNAVGQIANFNINQNFENCNTTQTGVIVNNGGLYKIDYGFTFSSVGSITLCIYIDDLDISMSNLLFTTANLSNSGSLLINLDDNNEISVRVISITGEAILPEDIMNGYLIVTPAV